MAVIFLGVVLATLYYYVLPAFTKEFYIAGIGVNAIAKEEEIKHIKTPKQVKALYVSSWAAGSPEMFAGLVKIAEETEINSLVIDIKDYTGKIAFEVNDPILKEFGSTEKRIADIDGLIKELHKKNIYVIGRIATFQDPFMVKKRPDLAVKRASDGGVWRDRKSQTWLDPGATEVWDYMVRIAKESYSRGFDEINYDYIRFPSDGDMHNIVYPFSKGKEKHIVIREFFEHVGDELRLEGITTSADLFGMTTSTKDDMNIGQVLEDALAFFDYVCPMVYPSHYPPNWNGIKNPAANPYEVIKISMSDGMIRAEMSSTSPKKLRPWLQDFDLGADYTAEMVRKQITATYDIGLDSWMLWNASNRYTAEALLKE